MGRAQYGKSKRFDAGVHVHGAPNKKAPSGALLFLVGDEGFEPPTH